MTQQRTNDEQEYQDAMQQLADALTITREEVETAFQRYLATQAHDWRSAFLVVYAQSTRGDRRWMTAAHTSASASAAHPAPARQQHRRDRRRQKPI